MECYCDEEGYEVENLVCDVYGGIVFCCVIDIVVQYRFGCYVEIVGYGCFVDDCFYYFYWEVFVDQYGIKWYDFGIDEVEEDSDGIEVGELVDECIGECVKGLCQQIVDQYVFGFQLVIQNIEVDVVCYVGYVFDGID